MRRPRQIVLALLMWSGCVAPNGPARQAWTAEAPTEARSDRPESPEPPPKPARASTTAGNTTTVVGRRRIVKVDEYGDPFTVTAYEPDYVVDEEKYTPAVSCDVLVGSAEALKKAVATARPGQTICIRDGEYTDWDLDLFARGVANAPITITARQPGKVVLRGRVHIGLGGAYVVLRRIRIEGAQTAGHALVELRSKTPQGHVACWRCRVSELVVSDVDAGSGRSTHWLAVFGQENRVDHSAFLNKKSPGPMLVMWRPGDLPDNNLIDHNLFARRSAVAEGGEAIRLGDATEQRSDSFALVQDNLFEDLHGGREIVSSRASATAFLANTFRRCSGMLTLRHGDGAVVEGNLFLTGRVPNAGGIRVIDGHHRVVNNYVEGVRTSDDETGGLVLMSYDKGYTAHGYQAVVHVLVAHNTVVDSQQSLVAGGGRNRMPPKSIIVVNNLFAYPAGPVVRSIVGMADWQIRNNAYSGQLLGLNDASGFLRMDPGLSRASDGLARPDDGSRILGAAEVLADVRADMDDQTRMDRPDIGADQARAVVGLQRAPLQRADVGPRTYGVPLR